MMPRGKKFTVARPANPQGKSGRCYGAVVARVRSQTGLFTARTLGVHPSLLALLHRQGDLRLVTPGVRGTHGAPAVYEVVP